MGNTKGKGRNREVEVVSIVRLCPSIDGALSRERFRDRLCCVHVLPSQSCGPACRALEEGPRPVLGAPVL